MIDETKPHPSLHKLMEHQNMKVRFNQGDSDPSNNKKIIPCFIKQFFQKYILNSRIISLKALLIDIWFDMFNLMHFLSDLHPSNKIGLIWISGLYNKSKKSYCFSYLIIWLLQVNIPSNQTRIYTIYIIHLLDAFRYRLFI